jgi:hypothetical protein
LFYQFTEVKFAQRTLKKLNSNFIFINKKLTNFVVVKTIKMETRKELNLGYSDFKNIIKNDNYFVDKSLLIKDISLPYTFY